MNQWLESCKLNTYSAQSVASGTHKTDFCIAWVCGPPQQQQQQQQQEKEEEEEEEEKMKKKKKKKILLRICVA
jgi:hypothetical protein